MPAKITSKRHLKQRNTKIRNKRKNFSKKKCKKSHKNKKTVKFSGGSNIVMIIMMWMEGCGHCVALRDTWEKLKTEYANIQFVEMESRNLDQLLLDKYHIDSPIGYPTLVKIKNSVVQSPPTSRDIQELRKWIES